MTPTVLRRLPAAALQICTLTLLAVAPVFAQSASSPRNVHPRARAYKLDSYVERLKSADPSARSSVIVTLPPGAQLPAAFAPYARRNGRLPLINGQVLDLPNGAIAALERDPGIFRVHHNRPVGRFNYRTSVSVGALAVQESYGLTGAGVTVAVIDSGIATWHDDMSLGQVATAYPYGDQRVAGFVDFVNGRGQPYDDNGHGTHVTGIIAGNGVDSQGEKAGIAPNASIVSLKVLDADGTGTISNLIAALDWVAANHAAYNIRVVNVSIGAPVEESYWTDPLTLAAKAIVDRGIVVVGAAGNFGQDLEDQLQYGAITAPANAPWVLTVGASSTQGTLTRNDDVLADYSSNGPTYLDYSAKPDLVAPGTGTVSLATPGSTFYETKPQYLLDGAPIRSFKPYLSLTGTSMAAPVVSGAVALMLEANPSLTPNLVKAILQYTAQTYGGYDPLRQGAGFLNALGAVQLAQFYNDAAAGDVMPSQEVWSRHIIWGNQLLSGGYLNPLGSAWSQSVVWGETGDDIVWGSGCASRCKNIVWGTGDVSGDNVVWGTDRRGNIVWGTDRRGNIVWGTGVRKGNIVWGTGDRKNIVWGTDCGGADCEEVQWGEIDSESGDVWGTGCTRCNIVWGTSRRPNIVWGTGCTRCNIVWGTSENDVTWGSSPEALIFPDDAASEPRPDVNIEFGQSGSEGEL
ncbi:MAG: S8 family peptidase [Vicinamibacterales bacterium]